MDNLDTFSGTSYNKFQLKCDAWILNLYQDKGDLGSGFLQIRISPLCTKRFEGLNFTLKISNSTVFDGLVLLGKAEGQFSYPSAYTDSLSVCLGLYWHPQNIDKMM